MHIELTDQERFLVQQGQAVDVIDSTTNEAYVLLARRCFEQVRTQLPPAAPAELPEQEVPEGIRLSKEAYRRDLPELLKQKKLFHQWVAYHRHQQLGIAGGQRVLLLDCYTRGLADDEIYVGWIDPCGLIEEEEIDLQLHHVGFDDEDS